MRLWVPADRHGALGARRRHAPRCLKKKVCGSTVHEPWARPTIEADDDEEAPGKTLADLDLADVLRA